MIEVSETARRLKALRERAGLSMREVSEAMGWTITRYQHYEDRFRRRFLPVELIRTISPLFARNGVDPRELFELAGIEDSAMLAAAVTPPARPPASAYAAGTRDLPVMGAVMGGGEGFYFNEGEPKEFVARPVNLGGASNAFALYVDGESMEPRYFAGEILYVNPNRPITRNCFVAVELADGRGMIKQFQKRNDDTIVLNQLNPEKEIRLAAKDVKRMYRIVGSGEYS
jgi:phage repressor protein C with HTH and peptisase S24 domain